MQNDPFPIQIPWLHNPKFTLCRELRGELSGIAISRWHRWEELTLCFPTVCWTSPKDKNSWRQLKKTISGQGGGKTAVFPPTYPGVEVRALRIKIRFLYLAFGGVPRHFGRLGVRYSNSQRNSENFDMLDALGHSVLISRENPRGFSKSDKYFINTRHHCHVSEICTDMTE